MCGIVQGLRRQRWPIRAVTPGQLLSHVHRIAQRASVAACQDPSVLTQATFDEIDETLDIV
jgi:hypothetical protein